MDQSSLDRIARHFGGATTRRGGLRATLAAALGLAAVPFAASAADAAAGKDKDNDKGKDKRKGKDADDANPDRAGNRPGGRGAETQRRPEPAGPCGDGSPADNRCSANADCCTRTCNTKTGRCRCKSRNESCSQRRECCTGLVCTMGACQPPVGPTGPAGGGGAGAPGPTGPTGTGIPTGPTGAIQFSAGQVFGGTGAFMYDYANTGFVGIGTAGPTGALHVANQQAPSPALVVQAASGQTGPVSIWQDNTGAELFRLTSDSLNNLFLGNQAGGASITNADENIGIGKSVLSSITSAYRNVAAGNYALQNLTDGNSNVAIGYYALNTSVDGDYNTAIGRDAAYSLTTGGTNVAIGYEALYSGTTADSNVAVGNSAGYAGDTAVENVFIGYYAGSENESGVGNIYVGAYSGNGDTYGSYNIAIGYESGRIEEGDYNIAIGYMARVPDSGVDQQLSIGNLIYGIGLDGTDTTISTGKIGIGVKNPTQKLEVDGNVKATNVTVPSDLRLKQDIAPVSGALETVAALRPVTYGWKDTTRFGEKREYGLIAQEVAPVVPSVVHGSEADEFALDYAKLVPVLIGAIQELRAEIATLKRGDA